LNRNSRIDDDFRAGGAEAVDLVREVRFRHLERKTEEGD
jgi:hypothetical protein